MSELKIEGTLYKKFDAKDVSATFKKREFVIQTIDQYPQTVKFELTQDNCKKLDEYKEGDDIIVHFNVRGREWTSTKTGEIMYFTSLQAWRIEKNTAFSDNVGTTAAANPPKAETTAFNDELPF